MPLSSEPASGRRVLLLSAEDNWARVTVARLLKANADMDNVHTMNLFRALTNERLERLRAEIQKWRPDLVIIDTLSAYMGAARDMHRQNEVGEFLGMLTEMAEETGAAILGLAHLNKQSKEPPLYRIVGSIGFVASIRSALFFGVDPDDPGTLALAHGKANASELGNTIVFERSGNGRVVQVLNPVGFSDAGPAEVCAVPMRGVGRPSAESEAAAAFVLELLEQKPMPWANVLRAAEARSIASVGTLNNVRTELSKAGKIVQIGKGPRARWRLASDGERAARDQST